MARVRSASSPEAVMAASLGMGTDVRRFKSMWERIASGSSWTLVWQGGEELRLKAIALDREFSGDQEGWGITDGSAGLRGRIIKSDDLAEIKLFAATFLSGAAERADRKRANGVRHDEQPLAEQRAI